jgi:hypothetical protein
LVFNISILSKKAEETRKLIDVQEAYHLWDLLTTNYQAVTRAGVWQAYAHDLDLLAVLKIYHLALAEQADELEKEAKKYGIHPPERPSKTTSTSVNSEIITDEYIAKEVFIATQEKLESELKAIRTSTTNDAFRGLLIKFLSTRITQLDSIIKYLKAKGWIGNPPPYPSIPSGEKEKLDSGEAFHLWDHLTFRYDNIEQTQMWYEYAYDDDFRMMLKKGLQDSLQQQADILEKELIRFGIPMPKRPPSFTAAAENTNIFSDRAVYRNLIAGIIGAAILHALALKQSVTNDRIRGIFKQLLVEEVMLLDKLIKFGKVKGWLNPVPQYKPLK